MILDTPPIVAGARRVCSAASSASTVTSSAFAHPVLGLLAPRLGDRGAGCVDGSDRSPALIDGNPGHATSTSRSAWTTSTSRTRCSTLPRSAYGNREAGGDRVGPATQDCACAPINPRRRHELPGQGEPHDRREAHHVGGRAVPRRRPSSTQHRFYRQLPAVRYQYGCFPRELPARDGVPTVYAPCRRVPLRVPSSRIALNTPPVRAAPHP